jgi:plastocyanin
MTKTGWIVVGIIIIIAAAALLWWSEASAPAIDQGISAETSVTNTGTSTDMMQNASSSAPMSATVTYDGTAFSPSTVTIMQGGTVTWIDTNGQMWVASNPHPIHNGYDGTTKQQHCAPGYAGPAPFDACAGGTSFSFTFDKVGSWGYHDHLNDSVEGVVNVVASDMPGMSSSTPAASATTSAQ